MFWELGSHYMDDKSVTYFYANTWQWYDFPQVHKVASHIVFYVHSSNSGIRSERNYPHSEAMKPILSDLPNVWS